MELDLRLGNDPPFAFPQKPPPPSSSHPTPLDFSLSFSSILQPPLNSPLPPATTTATATSRRSSQTVVITGATKDGGDDDIDDHGGELGFIRRLNRRVVWSIRENKEEREGKVSENEEDENEEEEEEEEMNFCSRKKLRLSRQQSEFLEQSFKQHHTLYPKQKVEVARKLNLRPRQVEVWFQNRRARTKLKQTEVDCEYLKKLCETLTQQNTKLQKELQDLRALKTTHSLFMHSPPTTLTLCASCERAAATPNSR